jgi:hypothetical protein
MSQPDRGGALPADDSAGDDDLYNPITYEQEVPAPEPDAWVAGDPGAGAGVPVAGVPEAGGPALTGWAPANWVPSQPVPTQPVPTQPVPTQPAPSQPALPETPQAGGIWPDESWPPRVPRKAPRPRWVIAAVAVVVVAAAAGTAFALSGSPSKGRSAAGQFAGASARPSARATFPPGMAPPLTLPAAKAVLSRYTAANNAANARMDSGLLGGYETGGSQALDASVYTTRRAEGARPYPAYAPAGTQFYIPVEPAAYPHWFAVKVTNQALGGKHQGLSTQYLLFSQSGPGAAWKDETEPYLLGGGAVPQVTLDASGYATAVSFDEPGLALPPSQLAQATADSLDGHGTVRGPGNLADAGTVSSWRARLPKGSAATDHHTQTGYGIVGLRTADGGALLFYTDAAVVTFTAPHGKTMRLSIPGFLSSGQKLSWAGLRFLDQLATYDPPHGAGNPRVVADYSGIQHKL